MPSMATIIISYSSSVTGGLSTETWANSDSLDDLVLAHLANLSGDQRDALGRAVQTPQPIERVREEEDWRESGSLLALRLIRPLGDILAGASHLIISPDGLLARLPFETLPYNTSHLIIETCKVSYVESARFNDRVESRASPGSGAPIVVGAPDFELGSEAPSYGFTSLNGACAEVEAVAGILGVQAIVGAAAVKSVITKAGSPRILHVATHGYYLAPFVEESTDTNGQTVSSSDRLSALAEIESPLIRSGLALAGANTWLRGNGPSTEAENGLLCAEDVLEMDMASTELVVLSACESGLGNISSGQGVFGLRRAFIIAGVDTLIVSLWKVADEATCDLMVMFYQNLLNGKDKVASLRDAQLALRLRYPHPRDWAAFVCLGGSGPMVFDRVAGNCGTTSMAKS